MVKKSFASSSSSPFQRRCGRHLPLPLDVHHPASTSVFHSSPASLYRSYHCRPSYAIPLDPSPLRRRALHDDRQTVPPPPPIWPPRNVPSLSLYRAQDCFSSTRLTRSLALHPFDESFAFSQSAGVAFFPCSLALAIDSHLNMTKGTCLDCACREKSSSGERRAEERGSEEMVLSTSRGARLPGSPRAGKREKGERDVYTDLPRIHLRSRCRAMDGQARETSERMQAKLCLRRCLL